MSQAQQALSSTNTQGFVMFSVVGGHVVQLTYSDGSVLQKNTVTGEITIKA